MISPSESTKPTASRTTIPPPLNLQPQSPLLSLPQELLDKIYTHLFTPTSDSWIRIDVCSAVDAPLFLDCCGPLDDSHARQFTGFILSCKFAYHQTIEEWYYSKSVFYMYNFNAGMRRLAVMGPERRKLLKEVRVCASPRSELEFGGSGKDWSVDDGEERMDFRHSATQRNLDALVEGLGQLGIIMREGVLRPSAPPAGDWVVFEEESEEVKWVKQRYGRGPVWPKRKW